MRDKFHFNLREDEWELKSNKGFVEGSDAGERGGEQRTEVMGKGRRKRGTERRLLDTLGKPMSWKTKRRESEAAESESSANSELI